MLPQKISSDHEYVGFPTKAQPRKNSNCNNEGDRNMDGQEPLGGEALYICSPVSEWDIQNKNTNANDKKLRHGDHSKIPNYSGTAGIFQRYRLSNTMIEAIYWK